MPVPEKILEFVERFDRNLEAYKQGKYNEAQVRCEFIDPFFEALGWDIANKQGYAEAYKDVVHEDAIRVGRATKAPDYSFRIGGIRKFFLEAKKPSIDLRDNIHPAYQLRRYAWSAKLPLSILTDFEEFAVYDCRTKPVQTDKASHSRILYATYTEYPERWEEIAGIFSREAILKGSFDRYVASNKSKRGTAEVDSAFLHEIERWRDLLARNIALRNPGLTQRELNFSVQRTIDRIIFLRICEDRGVELYGKLMALRNGHKVYERLFQLFHQADDRYNSGLFHFQSEKERSGASDDLTPDLTIDDAVLKDLLKNLYYPDSPYEFSVLPSNILGQIYEQFLGKIIRLTPAHRAVVEYKPEVRKASGVYYTPTYIVDYIVRQTVGKLVEEKKPGPRGAVSKLRILDPACGSGSFLLGAYQFLLNWHRDQYVNDDPYKWAKGRSPRLYQRSGEEWRLTTDERKRILLNNIYGVDVDPQAVEVTKLSLLLKVLEGEDEQTIARQLSMLQKRVLPDLGNNIKCGNSLIGPDFYDGRQISFLDEEEMVRINAFDWEAEFAEIMQAGGFDAVIGNPPYIRIQALNEWAPLEVEFYKNRYTSVSKGNYDIYVVFVEKGLSLLNAKGRLGFILPNKFFNAKYGESLRCLLADGQHLSLIIHFGDQQVFAKATTYTCLLFLEKRGHPQFRFVKAHSLTAWRQNEPQQEGEILADKATAKKWSFVVGLGAKLFERLTEMPIILDDIAKRIFQGLVTGADPVFIMKNVTRTSFVSQSTGKIYEIESVLMHPLCKGSVDLKRYHVSGITKSILFPYKLVNGKAELLSVQELTEKYPNTWAYLKENRQRFEERERGKWKHSRWYAYSRSQNLSEMEQKKILTPSIAKRTSFTFDRDDYYYFTGSGGGGGGGYGITLKNEYELMGYFYLLGLLNSRLFDWLVKQNSSPFRGGYYAYNRQYIEQLPIRTINFSDPTDKVRHDRMVALVNRMLDLHKQLPEAKTPQTQTVLKRQIETTDRQIDELVYELYDLTEEEIKIVEESLG
jgi:type I restriction-modification system DNA methylase subunit/predicted type IV restriction endonuclease